jgi:hypothetical protein
MIASKLTGSAEGRTALALLDLYNSLGTAASNHSEEIERIKQSMSWRITKPLRYIGKFLK